LGRRGSGKSTLLKRIEVEIRENKKLNEQYIPVNLAEEQAGIYRLMDLWEQVLQELCSLRNETFEAKRFSEFDSEQAYTRYLYDEIHRFCETNKKKAVLLLDNFDRIVGNFSDDGHLLRETLINYRDLVLIAASTRMDEHFWQYDKPFYEFFRRHHLEALSSSETFLLLNHWSDSLDFDDKERKIMKDFLKKHRGKVENIRLLTDGLPRTMLFFLKLVVQTDKPVEVNFLKKIMDEVTPIYQERLRNLTPQMSKIVLELAFMWEAVPTKEIAEKCKMESKLVSANLITLANSKIVDIIETDKRNNLYRISERFFNMWLIVTQGNPEQKRKARWMTEFLESWYDKQELQSLAEQLVDNLKKHAVSGKEVLLLSKGLSQSKYIDMYSQHDIITLTKEDIKDSHNDNMIHLPDSLLEISNKIKNDIEKGNYQQAINIANSIENREEGWKENLLAYHFANQNRYDEAKKYFLLAIQKGKKEAMSNLGLLYYNQERYDEAEKYYLMAIEKGDEKAKCNIALIYYAQNQNKEKAKQYISRVHFNLSYKSESWDLNVS
jgi:Flp pilus assembly protein TadD